MIEFTRGYATPSGEVLAIDSSTGDPVALAYDASGLTCGYRRYKGGRPTQGVQSMTLVSLGSDTASWTERGWRSLGDGVHRVDLPAAAVARGSDGADSVIIVPAKSGVTFVSPRIMLREPELTETEIQQLRYRIGIDGTTNTPATNLPNLGRLTVAVSYGVFAPSLTGTDSGQISVIAATRWIIPLSGVEIPSGVDKWYFTVKESSEAVDNDAILQLKFEQPADTGTDGIVRLNKAAVTSDRTKASVELNGDLEPTFTIEASIASVIPARSYVWDIKTIDTDETPDAVEVIASGTMLVQQSITKAIS